MCSFVACRLERRGSGGGDNPRTPKGTTLIYVGRNPHRMTLRFHGFNGRCSEEAQH